MFSINLFAVGASAIAAFIIGFLFHGPLFGKTWMRLANIHPTGNEKLKDMIPQMLWNLFINFVTALVLVIFYSLISSSFYFIGTGVWGGVICSLLVWAGFLVTTTSIEVIWMGRSVKLWLFECASSFVVMFVMGLIIACWN